MCAGEEEFWCCWGVHKLACLKKSINNNNKKSKICKCLLLPSSPHKLEWLEYYLLNNFTSITCVPGGRERRLEVPALGAPGKPIGPNQLSVTRTSTISTCWGTHWVEGGCSRVPPRGEPRAELAQIPRSSRGPCPPSRVLQPRSQEQTLPSLLPRPFLLP